jgi:hypothetical protein
VASDWAGYFQERRSALVKRSGSLSMSLAQVWHSQDAVIDAGAFRFAQEGIEYWPARRRSGDVGGNPHIQDLGGVYLRHVLVALAIAQRAGQYAAG